MASINLKLKTLAFGSQSFNYHFGADFFNEIEQTEVRDANVEVAMTVTRTNADYFDFEIECKGTLTIPCDRCLDDMVHTVDTLYSVRVKPEGDEYDDSRDEVLLIPENWREFDVAPLLRDTILLTIPLTHVHPDGECNSEMASLLSDHAAEGLDEDRLAGAIPEDGSNSDEHCDGVDPRWEALRKLTENN